MPLSIVFMGTPDFAVPSLKALIDGDFDVRLVVTQPDRQQGRGKRVKPPPVKKLAAAHQLDVYQPEKLRTAKAWEHISSFQPDFLVVVAYGKILGPRYLGLPSIAPINVHASLLPRLRGAAPIHWAIVRGDQQSGCAIMQMEEGLDTGPVYRQEAVEIGPTDTAGTLHDTLATLGARLLVDTLPAVAEGLTPTPQAEEGATYAPMLSKADGALRFDEPASQVSCRARGMLPWPGAFCRFRGKFLKIHDAVETKLAGDHQPGELVGLDEGALIIACQDGAIAVKTLQLAGKKRQDAVSFYNGYTPEPGECLTPDDRVSERGD